MRSPKLEPSTELPVPADEVRCIPLNNETLQVDGNFSLMRSGRIDFSVELSAKGNYGLEQQRLTTDLPRHRARIADHLQGFFYSAVGPVYVLG